MEQPPKVERDLFENRRSPTDGWLLRSVNRRLSAPLTRLFLKTGLKPTQITAITFLVTVTSALLVARGNTVGLVIGGLLFQLAAVLDCCDGEVARIRLETTPLGAWLDTLTDRLGFVFFLLASLWALGRQGRSDLVRELGVLSLASLLTATLLGYAASSLWKRRAPRREVETYRRFSHWLRSRGGLFRPLNLLIVLVSRREYLALLFSGLAIANYLEGLLILTTVGGILSTLILLILVLFLYYRAHDEKGLMAGGGVLPTSTADRIGLP